MKGDESIPRFTPPVLVGDIPTEHEEEYLKWAAKNGIWHAEAMKYPSYTANGVRGVVAIDNIYAGEDLIRVPENLMVCRETIIQNPVLKKAIDTVPGLFDSDEDANLALWITYHRCVLKEASPFWNYVRILPDLDLLSDWPEEELVELGEEDMIETVMHRRARFNSIAAMAVEILNEKLPDDFPSDRFTFPWFRWAYKQVSARGFGSRLSFVTMVPLADCFNHSHVSSVYSIDSYSKKLDANTKGPSPVGGSATSSGDTDAHAKEPTRNASAKDLPSDESAHSSDGYFRIKVFPRHSALETPAKARDTESSEDSSSKTQPQSSSELSSDPGTQDNAREVVFAPGEEITICYGSKDNFNLLLDYGFPLDYNPNETFPLPPPRWKSIYPSGMAPTNLSLRVQELAGSAQVPDPLKYNRWPEWSMITFRQWALGQVDGGQRLMDAWKVGKIGSFKKPFPSEICNPLDVERNALLLFLRYLTALAQEKKGEYVLSVLKRRIHWRHASLSLGKLTADENDPNAGSSSDSSQDSLVVYLDNNVYSVAPRKIVERMQGIHKRGWMQDEQEDPTDLFRFSELADDDTNAAVSELPSKKHNPLEEQQFLPYADNVPIRFLLCLLYRATRYNLVLSHIAYAAFVIALLECYQLLKREDKYDPSKSLFWPMLDTDKMKRILLEPLEDKPETKTRLQRNRDLFFGCKSIDEIVRTTTPNSELASTTSSDISTKLDYYYPLPDETDVPRPLPPSTDVHPTHIAIGAGFVSALYLLFGPEYVSSLCVTDLVESVAKAADDPDVPNAKATTSPIKNVLVPTIGTMDEGVQNTIAAVITSYAETGNLPTAMLEFVTSVVRSVPELAWE